jgi:fatty-acyl-CoA synthase
VIGVPHPKWDERPLLVVVRKPDAEGSGPELRQFLTGKIAKWWLPDDVDKIPHTGTGKVQKTALRARFGQHRLASAAE